MRRFINRLLRRGTIENTAKLINKTIKISTQSYTEAERLVVEGNRLEDTGHLEKAKICYQAALELCPDFARAWLNIGNIQAAQKQFDEAVNSYRQALQLEANYGAAHANLGQIYLNRKDYLNAAEHYSAATRMLPNSADAWVGVGCAMEELQRHPEALEAYHKALAIQPGFLGAKLNLGRLLAILKRPDEALEHIQEALSSQPNSVLGHFLFGKVLSDMGFALDAVDQIQQALKLEIAADHNMASLMLFNMNYLPDYPADALFFAHLNYGQQFCSDLYPKNPQYSNPPEPARILKIGYISGDFRGHPVSRFVEPLFAKHDRIHFEIHGFHNHHLIDSITIRLKELVDFWHPIHNMEDADVAQQIRGLGIDILVDLSGHTEFHRLPLFAHKPAPVQATWLGYLATTGLATMDYRICDIYTDPPGLTERFHTEQLARLPDCQWCYAPYVDLSPIGELPLLRKGYLTLGSFNNPSKLNERVLELWADVLNAIPASRLQIAAVAPGRAQQRILSILERAGVELERIQFTPRLPYRDYLASITEVDIALDPFPYNGGTTSIDTLIMGVPVVTLAGDRSIARGGVSLLSNLGLTELIAATPQDYVNIVRQLADDPARLATLRSHLREWVQASPLMDQERFTRNLEALYQQMWHTWCDTQRPHPAAPRLAG